MKLVQPTIFVAERARDLVWEKGIILKGADGIHVASALEIGCTELLTNDRFKEKNIENIPRIERLGIRVIHPSQTNLLPSDYRQQKLGNEKS